MRCSRFKTRQIQIGSVPVGGDAKIVIQSMTTSDTMDIEATVAQVKELSDAGCDIVRITAPTVNDAEALGEISKRLRDQGCSTPLVADIHFLPKAAFIAADHVEKVRINPGNFADRKMFKTREYTDQEYQEEISRIEEKFSPLVEVLKKNNRALRIGTNHGSLSDRVMNRYGDTPEGMIESAFEYAEICRKLDFHNFCFSMKASNVGVMIRAYRLLVDRQKEKGWDYPIHLGVTEAGEGEDARIKSAIGIGTLLSEGIGDTIRVSLTEASVKEVPVAQAIAKRFSKSEEAFDRAYSLAEGWEEMKGPPTVWLSADSLQNLGDQLRKTELRPDVVLWSGKIESVSVLKSSLQNLLGNPEVRLALPKETFDRLNSADQIQVEHFLCSEVDRSTHPKEVVCYRGISELKNASSINPSRSLFSWSIEGAESLSELDRLIEACAQVGTPFIDLAAFGIMLESSSFPESLRLSFGILQATRRRMSKTEYIACPSCGRTLFDLEETTARIKKLTAHLKGVKIAVMGCIVNGPGEMADADFGYVGGAPGKVNLYVEKDCVERNIASSEAPERLVELIKKHGRWFEPGEEPKLQSA